MPQCLRPLALGLSLAALGGCSIHSMAPPVHAKYVKLNAYRCAEPLAREVRFTYTQETKVKAGQDSYLAVADPITEQAFQRTGTIPLLTSSTALTNRYAYNNAAVLYELAEDASEAGQYRDAANYLSLSIAADEIRSGNERVNATFNMLVSVDDAMNALSAALAPAWAKGSANKITQRSAYAANCVGQSAPEGSVLHLDLNHTLHGTAFTLSSQTDYEVTAILDREGKQYRADRGYPVHVFTGDEADSGVPAEYVSVRDSIAPSVNAYQGLDGYELHLVILARAAIADVDRQFRER